MESVNVGSWSLVVGMGSDAAVVYAHARGKTNTAAVSNNGISSTFIIAARFFKVGKASSYTARVTSRSQYGHGRVASAH